MNWSGLSVPDILTTDDWGFRDFVRLQQLHGIIAMLIGTSQVLLGMSIMSSSEPRFTISSWPIYVLGGGGWLLIGIGVNLFQGRTVFDGGWIESKRVLWVSTAVTVIFSVGIAIGTVLIVFS